MTCHFTIVNDSAMDRWLHLHARVWSGANSRLFDEFGNEYIATEAQIGSDANISREFAQIVLVPQVVTKAMIRFDKFNPEATMLTLLRVGFWSDRGDTHTDFRNVQLIR